MISLVIPFCIILIRAVKDDIARFYTVVSRIRLKADLQLNQRENKVE